MRSNDVDIEAVLYENVDLPVSHLGMGGYNNSHYFLLPLLDLNNIILFKGAYVGTYIADHGRTSNLEDCIYVLFRFSAFEGMEFNRIAEYFRKTEETMFSYYAGHNKGNLLMYVLKVPEDKRECFDLIRKGEYSKTPDWYVNTFKHFPFAAATRRRLKGICRKEEWHKNEMESFLNLDLGNNELWSNFEPQREIFRYDKKKGSEGLQKTT
jgi:hypothetical protein